MTIRRFAYFILTNTLIALWSEQQRFEQFEAVGYEVVFTWREAIGDDFVSLYVFSLPGLDASHLLRRANFEQIARRAVVEADRQLQQTA